MEFFETIDILRYLLKDYDKVHWTNPPSCIGQAKMILGVENQVAENSRANKNISKKMVVVPYVIYSCLTSGLEILKALIARLKGKKRILYISNLASFLVWDGQQFKDVNDGLFNELKGEGFRVVNFLEIAKRNFDSYYLKNLLNKTSISEFLFSPFYFLPGNHFKIEKNVSKVTYGGLVIDDFILEALRKETYVDLIAPKILLRILKPEIIFERGGFGRRGMTFNLIAKRMGMETVDLQHGVLSKHSPYIYPGVDPDLDNPLPGHVFVFGEHFKDVLCANGGYRNGNVPVTGNPHLRFKSEMDKKQTDVQRFKNKEGATILVTTQYLTEDYVVPVVKSLSKMNKDNLFLIKTHPAEKNEVYEKYFEGRDNIIVLPKKYDIFDAFSIADVHLTCWSTCAYEAILFGVRTILIPTRSSSDLADLIENDIAQIGDSVEDMDKMISSKSKLKKDQIEAYYASVNPYKTIIEFVRKMKV
jgi:hypothetical protein